MVKVCATVAEGKKNFTRHQAPRPMSSHFWQATIHQNLTTFFLCFCHVEAASWSVSGSDLTAQGVDDDDTEEEEVNLAPDGGK